MTAPADGQGDRLTSQERANLGLFDGGALVEYVERILRDRARPADEDGLRAALAELVALKDGPRDAEYERRKPLAWDAARAVLAAHPEPGGPTAEAGDRQADAWDRGYNARAADVANEGLNIKPPPTANPYRTAEAGE